MIKQIILYLITAWTLFSSMICFSQPTLLRFSGGPNMLSLGEATLVADSNDALVVRKAVDLFQADIARVIGKKPALLYNQIPQQGSFILLGTPQAVSNILFPGGGDTISYPTQWESYLILGLKRGVVITGQHPRAVAFGALELSKQMGVSPWYWWADVPVQSRKAVFINRDVRVEDAPQVKYRGIFINDEAPALAGWAKEKFGGFNHRFYAHVFELMLRLKSNYIWPAMWGSAFFDDDSLNQQVADSFGIVLGTSHHEPMMRAHDEWRRYGGKQAWNYTKSKANLQQFWKQGLERATQEKIVTVGMRGDGDEPMTDSTATSLLEEIVRDQRQIIETVTQKPAEATPQVWALYKEVLDYVDQGMRVPDDVTLLFCDDNWGNLRRVPPRHEPTRKGGYGIYYHFDYVGGPRNYKWINTNALPRVWEQLHLAYAHGIQTIWIVNVGDIKPMELPMQFFLDYAWNPDRIKHDDIQLYHTQWAASQFGANHAAAIGQLLAGYAKINARRKPELLDQNTYALHAYNEWGRVVADYQKLARQANEIEHKLDRRYRPAFFQLVQFPIQASANLNRLYQQVALNHNGYAANDPRTNTYAAQAKRCFQEDTRLTQQYHQLLGGKWNHLMSQTHIGYTYWQQPPQQVMPTLYYLPNEAVSFTPPAPKAVRHPKAVYPTNKRYPIFYQLQGSGISMDADHASKMYHGKAVKWTILADHGRTGNAVTSFPVTAASSDSLEAKLAFECYSYGQDSVTVHAYFSPTLNYLATETGLRYGVSLNEESPQIQSIHPEPHQQPTPAWEKWVSNQIIIRSTKHKLNAAGKQHLYYWMVDSGVVLQKLVMDFGDTQPSFLGPPETVVMPKKPKKKPSKF